MVFYARYIAAFSLALCLTGCASKTPCVPCSSNSSSTLGHSPNPDVTKKIVSICTHSGFFALVNGAVSPATPAALPASILDSGVDKVCMHPEIFSTDPSTVDWLLKSFSDPL